MMKNEGNFLEELNESQRQAVLYNDGPSLVIAGAGAGKTRVLTYKIAYLLELGLKPWNILALTFTNKAAREMKERIATQVGMEVASRLWMGTFHSIFCRILRKESEAIGFGSNFTIYDQADSRSLIKSIIKEMQLDDKVYKPATVCAHISNAKNNLIDYVSYGSYRPLYEADQAAKIPATMDIYRRYAERCRQAGAMDFDDLLLYTYRLFDTHTDICARYAEHFQFVLVDEYQDTNYAQHCIVQQLTHRNQHVCVVGDDAQSIYSFRGANIDNILRFKDLYPNTKLFKLERNYRSTKRIVAAANSLIAHNERQIRKDVFSEKEEGAPIEVFAAYSDVEEGEIVVNEIQKLHQHDNVAYDGFAILYRTNAQSRIFEEALRKRGMPYRIYGGLSFYQRKEIKDMVAYFRLAVNCNDEEAFKRIINYPTRGIGQTTVDKIVAAAVSHSVSLWDALCDPLSFGIQVNKGTLARLQAFRVMMESFVGDTATADAYTLAMRIVKESGVVADIYSETDPEHLSSQENLEELLNGIKDFVDGRREEGLESEVFMSDYLQEVSLLSDLDQDKGNEDEKVTLMTVHSAKGLEFRIVFVVGMEENLFPSMQACDNPRGMEEERRLLYVAITRAESRCFLSYARNRYRFGKSEFCNPSRFLNDIDPQYLRMPKENESPQGNVSQGKRFQHPVRKVNAPSLFGNQAHVQPPSPPVSAGTGRFMKRVSSYAPKTASAAPPSDSLQTLKVGQVIEHERFGVGDVVKVEGSGDNLKATVQFRNAGVKQLLLKFARFKILG
jgi:DNA helicase-2/ATP-dependent DNA helicase PcrA